MNLGVRLHLGEQFQPINPTEKQIQTMKAGFATLNILQNSGIKTAIGHGIFLGNWIDYLSEGWCGKDTLSKVIGNCWRIEICPFSNIFLIFGKPSSDGLGGVDASCFKEFKRHVDRVRELNSKIAIGSDDPLLFHSYSDVHRFFPGHPKDSNSFHFWDSLNSK